jgi:hypothetical protein
MRIELRQGQGDGFSNIGLQVGGFMVEKMWLLEEWIRQLENISEEQTELGGLDRKAKTRRIRGQERRKKRRKKKRKKNRITGRRIREEEGEEEEEQEKRERNKRG